MKSVRFVKCLDVSSMIPGHVNMLRRCRCGRYANTAAVMTEYGLIPVYSDVSDCMFANDASLRFPHPFIHSDVSDGSCCSVFCCRAQYGARRSCGAGCVF